MPLHLTRNIRFRHVDQQLSNEQMVRRTQREVFKFYHKPAETPILEQGSIRIGTLQKFRWIENPALVDQNEGVRIARAANTIFYTGAPIDAAVHPSSPMYSWAKSFIGNYAHGDISFEEIEFVEIFDFYIYSFSYSCTQDVVNSFIYQPFDCVSKIADVYALAEILIQNHPLLKGLYYSISPVIYRERYRTPSDEHPAPIIEAFEKDVSFAGNEEGRIIFFEFDPVSNRLTYDKHPLLTPGDFSDRLIQCLFTKWPMPTV